MFEPCGNYGRFWNADYVEVPVGAFGTSINHFNGWKENRNGELYRDLTLIAEIDDDLMIVYENGHDDIVKEFADFYEVERIEYRI